MPGEPKDDGGGVGEGEMRGIPHPLVCRSVTLRPLSHLHSATLGIVFVFIFIAIISPPTCLTNQFTLRSIHGAR